jgi:Fe-S cluster biosynthesis and repair protein YggX
MVSKQASLSIPPFPGPATKRVHNSISRKINHAWNQNGKVRVSRFSRSIPAIPASAR